VTDCPTCHAASQLTRDTLTTLIRAHEDHDAARRAQEDHEAAAHRIQPPRAWEPEPAVAVTWQSSDGVSYTFADAPDGAA
jgi:hypothetical protein